MSDSSALCSRSVLRGFTVRPCLSSTWRAEAVRSSGPVWPAGATTTACHVTWTRASVWWEIKTSCCIWPDNKDKTAAWDAEIIVCSGLPAQHRRRALPRVRRRVLWEGAGLRQRLLAVRLSSSGSEVRSHDTAVVTWSPTVVLKIKNNRISWNEMSIFSFSAILRFSPDDLNSFIMKWLIIWELCKIKIIKKKLYIYEDVFWVHIIILTINK